MNFKLSKYCLLIIGFLICSCVSDGSTKITPKAAKGVLDLTGDFISLGLFLFIFSQAFLQSLRFSRAFSMVDSQRLKLRATNKVLQKEIADRGRAEKALSESHKRFLYVLSNAVKFTPDGGRISVAAGIIEINKDQFPTADDNRHCNIIISVSDTGIGIEPKNLHRAFSPFEQVESSYSRKFQGTGLGLSLTKKLVELHGVKLWGESEGSGKGSTFHFIIPS